MTRKRGQLVWDKLIPWIIALGLLLLMVLLYVILSGKGNEAIEYIQSLFRFGR